MRLALASATSIGEDLDRIGGLELIWRREPTKGIDGMTARHGHGTDGGRLLAAVFPAGPPGAVVRLIVRLDAIDLPQGALGNESLDRLKERIPAKHEADNGLDARPPHRVLHRV